MAGRMDQPMKRLTSLGTYSILIHMVIQGQLIDDVRMTRVIGLRVVIHKLAKVNLLLQLAVEFLMDWHFRHVLEAD